MSKIETAISEIKKIDEISARDQWVNSIHPLVKLFLTLIFVAVTVSFQKYDFIGLLSMGIYPLMLFMLAEVPFFESISRLKVVLPLVCVVGIFNPFFDRVPVHIGNYVVWAGVISMLTLMVKGVFTVFAAYLLIATTSIEKICYALQLVHCPKILITQILLTYRYISVLLAEVNRVSQAYSLRAPGQKGVHISAWGSLVGQILLRSMDRGTAVYESMLLRGYTGEFIYTGNKEKMKAKDYIYLLVWFFLFIFLRKVPLLIVVGNIFS